MNYLQKVGAVLLFVAPAIFYPVVATAQSDAGDFKEAFLGQFEYTKGRIIALAEAMPVA